MEPEIGDKLNGKRVRYVLDTSVLVHRPDAYLTFEDNTVVLPSTAVRELEKHKHREGELGRNAREAIRQLDSLTRSNEKYGAPAKLLRDGVPLESGGKLVFAPEPSYFLPSNLPVLNGVMEYFKPLARVIVSKLGYGDDHILDMLREEAKRHPDEMPVLITRDISFRIQARLAGLPAADYLHSKAEIDLTAVLAHEYDFVVGDSFIGEIYTKRRRDEQRRDYCGV